MEAHDERYEKLAAAAEYLRARCPVWPEVAVALGSGLAGIADAIAVEHRFSFEEVPGFPPLRVQGHVGEIVVGKFAGQQVACLRGRVHRYEGHDWDTVVFPFRALALAGSRSFLITNAAGGLHGDMQPPELVLLTDHINLFGGNPLMGVNEPRLGPRFPDMSEPYSPRLRSILRTAAVEARVGLREGVYMGVLGPSFETAAEIRMFRAMGADVVGMSTVPETIALRHMGCEVAAISCVTNLGTGVNPAPVGHDHNEVVATAKKAQASFAGLLAKALPRFGGSYS